MADIRAYPFVLHLRGAPTKWVRHMRNGKPIHEGVGRSFWFRPLSAVISEAPVDDRELALHFHARTSDFQDVLVQAAVTFRIAEPARAVERIDFGVDPHSGIWESDPLEQIAGLLTDLTQEHAIDLLATLPLPEALTTAPARLRERIAARLADDGRLAEIGITLVAVRVGPLRPEPEVERALGTPSRETVQQEADRATFERRAFAVENERAIAENELHNQIALSRREEELVTQRGLNELRRVEDAAAAAQVEAAGQADATRLVGEADVEAERARLDAYRSLPPAILLGLALKELAGNLPQIERLTIAPDVLGDVLAQIGGKG